MFFPSVKEIDKENFVSIFWFRRDLRLHDNAGLYYALKENKNVVPIFIFDPNILNELKNPSDKRVLFIYQQLEELKKQLKNIGSDLLVFHSTPEDTFTYLSNHLTIHAIVTNHDYEPYAIDRDNKIQQFAQTKRILFKSYKDQVIFEKNEITKDNGSPYTVFTPYSNKWKAKLMSFYYKSYPTEKYAGNFLKFYTNTFISIDSLGFKNQPSTFPSKEIPIEILKKYSIQRDIPSLEGTSKISVHLRFGTVSIRKLVATALANSEKWLNELIWRDFYMGNILYHFPQVVNSSFKKEYDQIVWRNNENDFKLWCEGKTGYPIVDAGMRELNETGFMHNRVRMITASFLTKHLLIDWRWGESYFAEKLLDFELSSNNGGWQWAASSGCDAAPYFRIFNPYLQTQKFDPQLIYIKRWVPEFEDPFVYPKPIVQHEYARKRTLEAYKKIKMPLDSI